MAMKGLRAILGGLRVMVLLTVATAAPNALGGPAPTPFLQLAGFDASARGNILNVTLRTKGAIPTNGRAGAFGYAIMTHYFDRVLIVVTHLGITDSKSVGVGGFHTHVLDLTDASMQCSGHTAEVDLASATKPNYDPGYRFSIKGNQVIVSGVPVSALQGRKVEGVAAFTLKPIFSDKKLTNLCVDVVAKLPK